MLSEIANVPPSEGVVMNNAMTAKDAGSSDRLYSILEVVKSNRDSFRCCFDLYARNNRGAKGRLAFQIKLDPEGKFMEAKIKQDESDITAGEVESCMTDLVKTISWPKSPSGKETLYTHRFDFKPKN
ncbi:AgmX/PglI C-terminal domain-containing protein [Chondromyces apiculatus]|uniref:AgmX/PglI C-terminal domain-containing protein n=1 Tax=Chondromyces apiculatus TaxID=51 RepID=UPI0005C5E3F3|nr:AgmX/PglI C-terminal domain-containing protein [Chondromyces apiculatus]